MRLDTDFEDYYDELIRQIDNGEVYQRKLSNSAGKFNDLKMLRELGFETIDLKPVRKVSPDVAHVVVYTDDKKHMGEGKILLNTSTAQMEFGNYVCSEFIPGNECTLKVLQIGFKRFRLVIRNRGLVETQIEEFEEIGNTLFPSILLPIYSIDYVRKGDRVLACDFNQVQKLSHIGVDRYLPSALVVNEVHKFDSYIRTERGKGN